MPTLHENGSIRPEFKLEYIKSAFGLILFAQNIL